MRIVYEMRYSTPIDVKVDISLVKYSSEYKDKYRRLYNDCYHEMREALGIQPFDYIQDDSFFESGMETVYLLIKNGELIGSVNLKGTEIDDLLVNKRYQGQGYGKKLLHWAISNISTSQPVLHVSGWNKRALNLYRETGFKVINTIGI